MKTRSGLEYILESHSLRRSQRRVTCSIGSGVRRNIRIKSLPFLPREQKRRTSGLIVVDPPPSRNTTRFAGVRQVIEVSCEGTVYRLPFGGDETTVYLGKRLYDGKRMYGLVRKREWVTYYLDKPAAPPYVDCSFVLNFADRLEAKLRDVQKSQSNGASTLRRWARDSLARRFVRESGNPSQDHMARYGLSNEQESNQPVEVDWVNNPHYLKLSRIVKLLLRDMGIMTVGYLPYGILERCWQYFGEEHFAPHGGRCFCRLCRSAGTLRSTFLEALGDDIVRYFISSNTIVHAIFRVMIPAPLRRAYFLSKKIWRYVYEATH